MNTKRLLPAVCAFMIGAAACHSANNNTVADSVSAAEADTAVAAASSVSATSTSQMENEEYDTTLKGTFGSEPVVIAFNDLHDALDEKGTMWEKEGKLTYSSTGSSLELKGYQRRLYFFFDAYENGKKVGHLEFAATGEDYEGEYSDLKTGKTLTVKLQDVE